jgi:hypothetical protein
MDTTHEPLHIEKMKFDAVQENGHLQVLFESLLRFTKFSNMAMIRNFQVMLGQTTLCRIL